MTNLVIVGTYKGAPIARTPAALTKLAAQAKTKTKATPRGWTMLTQEEILALAWLADAFLEDAELPKLPGERPAYRAVEISPVQLNQTNHQLSEAT